MLKRITVFNAVFLYLLVFSFFSSIRVNAARISKGQVIKLISTQGTKKNYYFEGLSYELVNVDNDEELNLLN